MSRYVSNSLYLRYCHLFATPWETSSRHHPSRALKMNEGPPIENIPSDEEIAALLRPGGTKKPRKAGEKGRFPEALYYYMILLSTELMMIGVWGYMLRGIDETQFSDESILETALRQLAAIGAGIGDQAVDRPVMVFGLAVGLAAVFIPAGQKARRRLAYLLAALVALPLCLLIAIQFAADLENASTGVLY